MDIPALNRTMLELKFWRSSSSCSRRSWSLNRTMLELKCIESDLLGIYTNLSQSYHVGIEIYAGYNAAMFRQPLNRTMLELK